MSEQAEHFRDRPDLAPGEEEEVRIGPRLLGLEAGSVAELDVIQQRLTERNAFTGRRKTETWEAIVGVDPDRIEIAVSSSLTGDPIQWQDWAHLDQMVYEVGE